jgi:hypothetical protein
VDVVGSGSQFFVISDKFLYWYLLERYLIPAADGCVELPPNTLSQIVSSDQIQHPMDLDGETHPTVVDSIRILLEQGGEGITQLTLTNACWQALGGYENTDDPGEEFGIIEGLGRLIAQSSVVHFILDGVDLGNYALRDLCRIISRSVTIRRLTIVNTVVVYGSKPIVIEAMMKAVNLKHLGFAKCRIQNTEIGCVFLEREDSFTVDYNNFDLFFYKCDFTPMSPLQQCDFAGHVAIIGLRCVSFVSCELTETDFHLFVGIIRNESKCTTVIVGPYISSLEFTSTPYASDAVINREWWEDEENHLVGYSFRRLRYLERSSDGIAQLTYSNDCFQSILSSDELADWVTRRSSVRHFTLRGIDLGRLSALFYTHMRQCSSLERITITNAQITLDNNMGIGLMVQAPNLRHLAFIDCDIRCHFDIAYTIESRFNRPLHHLSFENCDFSSFPFHQFAMKIGEDITTERISFISCGLDVITWHFLRGTIGCLSRNRIEFVYL